MILSFPIGAYVVFNSDIGKEINYQYPMEGLNFLVGGFGYKIPLSFELGDAFVVLWTSYLILFSISYMGPKNSLLQTLSNVMSNGWRMLHENALVNMITWFTILILFSFVIDIIQQYFGINIESPPQKNNLIYFYQLSIAPFIEELGFRILLIGIPLFFIYSQNPSWKTFFKSLWRPNKHLHIENYNKVTILIITIGLLFGASHIISGTPWSIGKFSQATISGIIIGWVYVRYGFAPAVLIHWATNYFIFSYLFFISSITQTNVINELSNPFTNSLEGLILVTGIISLAIKIPNYIESRKLNKLDRVT